MNTYNPYEINTGDIFDDVLQNWKFYNRDFLKTTFNNALTSVLVREKQFTEEYSDDLKGYFQNYSENYLNDLRNADDTNRFPFPEYFLKYKKSDDLFASIVSFSTRIKIDKDDYFHDLFFALKLSLTDIMVADQFLQYHFENTFEMNRNGYQTFLENILIKYSEFLKDKHEAVVNRFIAEQPIEPEIEDVEEDQSKSNTLATQVLAIHYLIKEIKPEINVDKTDIARFIQFLTNRELGATDIRNTNIYKRVNSLLSITDKAAEKDLKFVRQHFETLGLASIVDKISKEINSKE